MALPLPNIIAGVDSPLAGNPLVNAMRGMEALTKESLVNKYYAPNIQSEINNRNALTQGQNIENQYMPDKLRLANAFTQLQNQWYAPKARSEIGLQDATAAEKRAEMPFISQKYANQTRNSLTDQAKLGTQLSNSFRMWAMTPEGQQIVKNRPDIANAILSNMENQAKTLTGNPMNSSSPVQETAPSEQKTNNPTSMNPLPENATRKDLIKDIQKGAEDSYERTNLPADTKKRLYAGARYKSTIPTVLNNFEKASVYFSPTGQAKLKADELKAATDNRVPEELQAYRKFSQGLEQLKVQGAFLEGVPADQVSRGNYAKIYDVAKFFNNKDDAMDSVKYAINLALMADKANMSSLSDLKNQGETDEEINKLMTDKNSDGEMPIIKVVRDSKGKLVRSSS